MGVIWSKMIKCFFYSILGSVSDDPHSSISVFTFGYDWSRFSILGACRDPMNGQDVRGISCNAAVLGIAHRSSLKFSFAFSFHPMNLMLFFCKYFWLWFAKVSAVSAVDWYFLMFSLSDLKFRSWSWKFSLSNSKSRLKLSKEEMIFSTRSKLQRSYVIRG